jgi:lipopolysaccharide transport system permease protein
MTVIRRGPNGAWDARPRRDRRRRHWLWLYAELLYILTWRDIKVRYKQSIMGVLWSILMPALIVGAGLLLRVAVAHLGGERLAAAEVATLSVKALPWAFFVSSLRFATVSLSSNANLLARSNVPRIVFPMSAVLGSLFDLLVATGPLVVILALCGVTPEVTLLWVPVLMALLVLLVTGLGILIAVGNVFLRDVKYIVEVILTFAIFFTPVLYDVRMLGDVGTWLLLNPVTPLLEGLSAAVVRGESPPLAWLAYSAVVSVAIFGLAWTVFTRLDRVFADYL